MTTHLDTRRARRPNRLSDDSSVACSSSWHSSSGWAWALRTTTQNVLPLSELRQAIDSIQPICGDRRNLLPCTIQRLLASHQQEEGNMTLNEETQDNQDNWMNRPQVQALIERLGNLEKMVKSFELKVGPLRTRSPRLRRTRKCSSTASVSSFAGHDSIIRELKSAKDEIDREMAVAAQLKQTVQGEINSTIEGLTAQADMAGSPGPLVRPNSIRTIGRGSSQSVRSR